MSNSKKNKAKKQGKRTNQSQAQTNAPARRTSRKQPKPRSDPSQHHTELVCSVTNPFCDAAYGAKVFDSGRTRTVSIPRIFRQNFATDATGACCQLWTPSWVNLPYVTATIVAGQATFATFPAASPSYVQSYRVVTCGLILQATQAPLNRAGTVSLRLFGAKDGTTFDIVNPTTYNCDQFLDIPLSELGAGYPVIFPKLDNSANLMWDQDAPCTSAANIVSWNSIGWPIVMISVTGATASTGVIAVTSYVHYEVVYADNDGNQQIATYPIISHPTLVDAATAVQSGIEAFAHRTVDSLGSKIRASAKEALRSVLRNAPMLVD